MQRLKEALTRPVPDTPRARRYQGYVDDAVADFAEGRTEKRPAESVAAWCWRFPTSRFYRNERLLAAAKAGLLEYRFERPDRPPGFADGWGVYERVQAFVWLYEALSDGERERLLGAFREAAAYYFDVIYSPEFRHWSNQTACIVATLFTYGLLLGERRYLDAARNLYDEHWRMIDENGQVIEQGGPSLHYMYLTIADLHRYWFLSNDARLDEPMYRAMNWWRYMHTESLHPIQGMSTRHTYDRLCHVADWAFGAFEHLAPRQPLFHRLMDRIVAELRRQYGHPGGPSSFITALLEHRGEFEPTEAHLAEWNADFDKMYRSPVTWPVIQHLLVRRRYQTGVTFVGYAPQLGLQTWAWGDEPPILQSAYEQASGTRGWGFDTALSNVSRTAPSLGAGLMVPQAVYVPGDPKGDFGVRAYPVGGLEKFWYEGCPCYVTTRHGPLWQMYLFTPVATVLIQGGDTGPRETTWAFHSLCVPEPRVGEGVVTFEGRVGRMYFLRGEPVAGGLPVSARNWSEEKALLRTLTFRYEGGVTAFAFSDASFRFGELDEDAQRLTFSDSSGTYEAPYTGILFPPGHKHAGTLVWDVWDGFPRVTRRPPD